ncbi:G2/mitotic-specific cyclin-B3-like isoform X2 [Macrobrachium nipponense]|uniref:G2/mitotic-specific cyclin-B3-like isoform X2 n=1 Tax=Macrobrachium nipponense TaxID=159736 RepID=UPI0030C86FFF
MASKHDRKLRPITHEVKKLKPSPSRGQENRAGLKVKTKQKYNDMKSTMAKKVGRLSINLNIAKSTKTKKQSEGDTSIYLKSKKMMKSSSGCSQVLHRHRRKHALPKQQEEVLLEKHTLQVARYEPFRKSTATWKSKTPFLGLEYEESYLQLSQETLYQAINLIDSVLEASNISPDKLQLLVITAVFIVAKLEEQEPPLAADLLGLTTYTLQEFLSMERTVLTIVDFNLVIVDPSIFLEYFAYLTCKYDDKVVLDCANFLMETVLVEVWPLETLPSLLAAAALFGSLRIIHGAMASVALCTLMPAFFNLDDSTVVSTSLRMLEALANRKHSPFQGASEKYRSRLCHNELSLLLPNPKLQPDGLLVIIDEVRATLISLRDVNIVIRDRHHHYLVNNGDNEERDDWKLKLRDVTTTKTS